MADDEVTSTFPPPDLGEETADAPDPAFGEVDEDEDLETPDDGEPEPDADDEDEDDDVPDDEI